MNKTCLYAAGALLALSTAPAHAADFIGDKIKASWRLPSESSIFPSNIAPDNPFTVGYGVEGEGQLGTVRFLIDFGVNDITFTFLTDVIFGTLDFNGIYFDMVSGDGFGTVLTGSGGLTVDRVHDMGNALSINFAGLHYKAGDKAAIGFTPSVPEPASWTMLITGFGIAGAVLRRRIPRQRIAFS